MRTHLTWLRPTEADRRSRAAWPVTAIHLCILLSLWAGPHAPVRAAGYSMDVDYSISGSSDIAPIQVFDDGQRTYIQFPNPARMPDVSIEHAQDHSPIPHQTMAPYIVINQVVDRIVLKSAGRSVDIAYNRLRAPTLAGLPGARGRQQSLEAATSHPLIAPVTFYTDDRERTYGKPGRHKPRHPAATARHAGENAAGNAPANDEPTSISVVSAASIMPLASAAPQAPLMQPRINGMKLPALPGNTATLPQLRSYQELQPIIALNTASENAGVPNPPLTTAGSPDKMVLPGIPKAQAVSPAALAATAPAQSGSVQGSRESNQKEPDRKLVAPASGAMPVATETLKPVQPAVPSLAIARVPEQPVRMAASMPVAEKAPVAEVRVASIAKAAVASAAKPQNGPANTRLAALSTEKNTAAKPAEQKQANKSAVKPVLKTAEQAVPPTMKLAAAARPPVPALDVAMPKGAVRGVPVAAVPAVPDKPPVRKDYTIQPGLLKQAFQQVADHYGYTLAWSVNEAKEKFVFDYPITLSGASFIEDLRSMDAMANTPQKIFVIDVYQANRIITVRGLEN